MTQIDNSNGVFKLGVDLFSKKDGVYYCRCYTIGIEDELEPDYIEKQVTESELSAKWRTLTIEDFDKDFDYKLQLETLADRINEKENRNRIYSHDKIK